MRKVYGMPGVAHAQLVLTSPSGKTKYKITFTDGITTSRDKTPAKYTTDNPIYQDIIENDPIFGKKVFLLNEYDITPAAPAAPAASRTSAPKGRPAPKKTAKPATADEPSIEVHDEVTDLGGAVTVLMEKGDVPGASLTSIEGVLAKAKEFGISFPNLAKE